MSLVIGEITKASVSGTAATAVQPGTSGVHLLTCNTDCYVRFDGDVATISVYDLFMPKGSAFIVHPKTKGAYSVIQDSAAGTFSVHEIE